MKYGIVHVNDRAKKHIEHNKEILASFEYVDSIFFFNGNIGNAWDVINHRGIRTDTWQPYDGRSFPPLPGEYGIWVSLLNVLDYIVENKVQDFLLLEDDILVSKDFVADLSTCMQELPKDYDFLSLYAFDGHNWVNEVTDVGLTYIHKSHNQFSAGQATVFSYNGARKLLKLVKRKGIEYTTDCFIFKQAALGSLNGYSVKPETFSFLQHKNTDVASLIDPENVRNT